MGWGHCSMEDAAQFAFQLGVKHLLLSHHDPSHYDLQLTAMFTEFLKKTTYPCKLELAVEGMEIKLK